MLLGGGLVFCLFDAFYIMKHLDTKTHNEQAALEAWARKHNRQYADHNTAQQQQAEVVEKTDPPVHLHHEYRDVDTIIKAKEPILHLIREAGIDYDPEEDLDLLEELPDYEDVVKMYGAEPVLYGLNEENCKRFQEHSDLGEHMVGVAGTFNSGTNLMAELLIHNCVMPERMKKYGKTNKGIRWQVPWGK
ncbi:MAG: hypothetical protein SGARI_007661, partial [Bacillariaceae sp.]